MRIAALALMILFTARHVAACTVTHWDDDDRVENEVTCSANGRFCVVLRRYVGIRDFQSVRAGDLFQSDVPSSPDMVAALYEMQAIRRLLIREITLRRDEVHDILVSDSGNIVAVRHYANAADAIVMIHDPNGSRPGLTTMGDVFVPYDITRLSRLNFALRAERAREVVVVSFREGERRIDVTTGALLDEKRAIFPVPRAWAAPVDGEWVRRDYLPPPAACAAAWDDPGLVRIYSTQLLDEAINSPSPSFPPVAIKARIRGTVQVEVLVSESGDVLCGRHSALPFGIDKAAIEAARQWKFRPFVIGGRAVQVTGELLFHFKDVLPEEAHVH